MKKCKVIINKNKETTDATFYGVFQKAYPIAVVDWGEGLKEVDVADVVEVE